MVWPKLDLISDIIREDRRRRNEHIFFRKWFNNDFMAKRYIIDRLTGSKGKEREKSIGQIWDCMICHEKLSWPFEELALFSGFQLDPTSVYRLLIAHSIQITGTPATWGNATGSHAIEPCCRVPTRGDCGCILSIPVRFRSSRGTEIEKRLAACPESLSTSHTLLPQLSTLHVQFLRSPPVRRRSPQPQVYRSWRTAGVYHVSAYTSVLLSHLFLVTPFSQEVWRPDLALEKNEFSLLIRRATCVSPPRLRATPIP